MFALRSHSTPAQEAMASQQIICDFQFLQAQRSVPQRLQGMWLFSCLALPSELWPLHNLISKNQLFSTLIFFSIDSMPHGCRGQGIMLIKGIIQGKAVGSCHDQEPGVPLLPLSHKYGFSHACSFLPLPQVCAINLSWCRLYKEIKGDTAMYSTISCHTQVSLSPIGLLLKEALLPSAYLSFNSSAPRISSPLSLCLQQLEPLEKWH